MESPPKFSETLEFIMQFLRAEGFYAAEEAVIREIENRCPDGSSPTASAVNTQLFAPPSEQPQPAEAFEFSQQDTEKDSQQPAGTDKEPKESSTGGEQDWRGRGELPEGASDDSLCRSSSYDQPQDSSSFPSSIPGTHRLAGFTSGEADEYSDEDDVGYVREYIRGQDAFIAREIDLSDEDASQRGLRLYHEAQGLAEADKEHADNEEDGSSDGQGSSYFSGEVIDRGNSLRSHVSPSRDKAAVDDERMVTLMAPVNPKPTSPPPSTYVVQPPVTPEAACSADNPLSPPPSSGPKSHPLSREAVSTSDVSSDCGENGQSHVLYHEPSLGRDPAIPDAMTEDTATSARDAPDVQASDSAGPRAEGSWTRGYLDPFGMLGKVFGRKNGEPDNPGPSAAKAEGDQLHLPEAVESGPKQGQSAVQGASVPGEGTDTLIPKSVRVEAAEGALGTASQANAAGSLQDPPVIPELEPELSPFANALLSAAERSDTDSSTAPETPKAAANGDSDSAFSFPVTPPSEPPAAAEPGAVFGTWPSLKHSSRKPSRGDLNSRASSDYAASGYSTDEGGSHLASCQVPHLAASRLAAQPGADTGRADSTNGLRSLGPEAIDQSGATRSAGRGIPPVSIQPLDMSTSLPSKGGLELAAAHKASLSPLSSEDGTLQAYKPPPPAPAGPLAEQEPEVSHRSGQLTERTMETAAGGEGSTAGGAASADDYSSVAYRWDEDYLNEKYEMLTLKIIHRRRRTGFEECKDIALHVNDLIAGRYQVTDFLGSAAFSQAVQALDIKTGGLVCLKIIKNNKDYLDQSLDEIKLLKYVNEHDPSDEHGILQLYDYFYYKEHLFLVCELLRANLYEFQKYNREHGQEPYFTLPRVQSIARQVLRSLAFMHSLDLIHCDLKPENILIKSYSRCEVKVIDLGSSCFTSDHLSSYVQSRSYRAPEVILGLPYHQQVDIWSLGCILAELLSGYVLLQNDSLATLMARLEGILGPVPRWMLRNGRYAHRYYTRNGALYEQSRRTGRYELLRPKHTSLKFRVPEADEGCLAFLSTLLTVDPKQRPSAAEALQHPWLQHKYPPITL